MDDQGEVDHLKRLIKVAETKEDYYAARYLTRELKLLCVKKCVSHQQKKPVST